MKLALMQPYLFPYIGYFQLVSTCDLFVIHDDVQYIKGGWINRNRILLNNEPSYFTLPLQKDHSIRLINERCFAAGVADEKEAILRKLENSYRKAPFLTDTLHVVARCFSSSDSCVASFVTACLVHCCQHLGIKTPIVASSTLKQESLKAEERVIAINKALRADHYINPIGGTELYRKEEFERQGIKLSFLRPREIAYEQFGDPFVPWLSIIDVLMFNSVEAARRLLEQYDLV